MKLKLGNRIIGGIMGLTIGAFFLADFFCLVPGALILLLFLLPVFLLILLISFGIGFVFYSNKGRFVKAFALAVILFFIILGFNLLAGNALLPTIDALYTTYDVPVQIIIQSSTESSKDDFWVGGAIYAGDPSRGRILDNMGVDANEEKMYDYLMPYSGKYFGMLSYQLGQEKYFFISGRHNDDIKIPVKKGTHTYEIKINKYVTRVVKADKEYWAFGRKTEVTDEIEGVVTWKIMVTAADNDAKFKVHKSYFSF